jgi:hypothetical protein
MALTNPKLQNYRFLKGMYADSYYPEFLVDEIKDILLRLCEQIEAEKPVTVEDLYSLTHLAINALTDACLKNDSEIETMARDAIGSDFAFIAKAYGYDADGEELIARRDW